jgi:hypothetical protein
MKKIILLLLVTLPSLGQITIQPDTIVASGYNFSGTWNVSSWTGYYGKDPGTNAYIQSSVGGGIDNHYIILRQNNRWLFVQQLLVSGSGIYLTSLYVASTPSIEIDPPCNDTWQYNISSITPNGGGGILVPINPAGQILGLTLSGTSCIPLNAHTLTGNLKYDINNDNCVTSNYFPSYAPLESSASVSGNGYQTTVDNNGNYTFRFAESGNVTTSITNQTVSTLLPVSGSHIVNWPVAQTTIANKDFCIKSALTGDDVDVALLPVGNARPGFFSKYKLVYTNYGDNTVNGNIALTYNGSIIFSPSSASPFTSSSNSITFNYTGLLPFETKEIDVSFIVFTPPTVNGGDINKLTATNNLTGTDINLSNNTQTINQTIVNGYDPNDATILEGQYITAAQAQNDLNFRLRFQNTGNASAINIRVNTQLDADLDWTTFQPVSASHPYNTVITSGNQISFRFDNINLIDSTTNEPASHGYVFFKVKPKSSFIIGDIVECQADIFFDFNPAVITNTATTQIPPPPSPSQSMVILPNVMSLPRLSNANILNIPTPEAGMIVFNIDNLCVMLYNGTSWNCL